MCHDCNGGRQLLSILSGRTQRRRVRPPQTVQVRPRIVPRCAMCAPCAPFLTRPRPRFVRLPCTASSTRPTPPRRRPWSAPTVRPRPPPSRPRARVTLLSNPCTSTASEGWCERPGVGWGGPSGFLREPASALVLPWSFVSPPRPVQGFLRKGRVLGSGAGSGQVGLRNHVEPISRLTSPHDTRWRHRQRRVRSSAPTRRRGRPPSSPSRTKYGLAPPVVLHSAPLCSFPSARFRRGRAIPMPPLIAASSVDRPLARPSTPS